jgi:hypothetical protein
MLRAHGRQTRAGWIRIGLEEGADWTWHGGQEGCAMSHGPRLVYTEQLISPFLSLPLHHGPAATQSWYRLCSPSPYTRERPRTSLQRSPVPRTWCLLPHPLSRPGWRPVLGRHGHTPWRRPAQISGACSVRRRWRTHAQLSRLPPDIPLVPLIRACVRVRCRQRVQPEYRSREIFNLPGRPWLLQR